MLQETPPQTASILDGINRKSVMEIARDLGYELVERDIARAELALADEVFLTGTAAELTPMVSIDDIDIGTGRPGEVTRAIQSWFASRGLPAPDGCARRKALRLADQPAPEDPPPAAPGGAAPAA